MGRKLILALVSLVIISAGFFLLYTRQLSLSTANPLAAIPENAVLIAKSRDFRSLWKQLSHTNLMWQELTNAPYFSQLDKNGYLLDSLIYENKNLNGVFDDLPLWTSLHMLGGAKFEFLYVFAPPVEEEKMKELLKHLSIEQTSSRVFESTNITTIKVDNYPKTSFFFSYYKGVILCSFSQVLIEDAIRQLDKSFNLLNDPAFVSVMNTSGEYVDANIYLQYDELNKLLVSLLEPSKQEGFTPLSHYADWASLDMTLKPNALMLNGFTCFNDSAAGFLSCFSGQKPQDMDILSIVPAKASNILCFGISNFERFNSRYRNHLKIHGKAAKRMEWLNKVNEQYGIDVEVELNSVMGNEFGTFYYRIDDSTSQIDRKFVALRVANFNEGVSFFSRLSTPYEGENESEVVRELEPVDFTGHCFGENFGGFEKTYYVAIEPYFVFANSKESLAAYIGNYHAGTFLSHDDNFVHFSENLASQSSIFMYSNFSRSKDFYKDYSGQPLDEVIESYREMLGKFEAVGVQLISQKQNLFYQNIYCNYNPIVKKESKSLWETQLDTTVATRPYTVLNHYTKAKEIFVQDAANKIYLIDNKGNILWKKQLGEPIMSDVWQIDVYKNDKLQLLFNTASGLHLIDRKGRYVENFPVALKSNASAPLTLIDYDNNKDYRILIPVNDKKILNFNAQGHLLKGWDFEKTKEPVTKPLQYFSLQMKDYIVGVDEGGNVYVLNRRGEPRLSLNEKLPLCKQSNFFIEMHNDIGKCKLVTVDSIGNIIKLTFDNHKENVNQSDFSGRCYFEYHDINNDRMYEYIYLDGDELKVMDQEKNKLYSIDFENEIQDPFIYFSSLGKYGKIGVLDREAGKIYLYLDAGGLAPDFPMNGTTLFWIDDVNSDGISEVIVGMGDALVTYSMRK